MKRPGKELENLLLQKSFEELSSEERNWVLEKISKETYASMRWTLLESGDAFKRNEPVLDPRIQVNLRNKVRRQGTSPGAAAIFNYKIPAWYAFAAASVLFLLFSNFSPMKSSEPEKVYVTVTDTVYKEVPFRLVDSTSETHPDTNIQTAIGFQKSSISKSNKYYKRINQSPIGKKSRNKKRDSVFVDLPNYEDALVTAYDTATLNSMINDYLQFPKERRRKNSDLNAIKAIQRIY